MVRHLCRKHPTGSEIQAAVVAVVAGMQAPLETVAVMAALAS
jgi:hypothetical protein